jgi:hypothetical protein
MQIVKVVNPLELPLEERWPRGHWTEHEVDYDYSWEDEDKKIFYSRDVAIRYRNREAAIFWIGIAIGAVVAFAIVYCAS